MYASITGLSCSHLITTFIISTFSACGCWKFPYYKDAEGKMLLFNLVFLYYLIIAQWSNLVSWLCYKMGLCVNMSSSSTVFLQVTAVLLLHQSVDSMDLWLFTLWPRTFFSGCRKGVCSTITAICDILKCMFEKKHSIPPYGNLLWSKQEL